MKAARLRIAQTIADKSLKTGRSKKLSREIAAYLLSQRRVGQLDSILRDVQKDWAEAGYVEVIAASAHSLSAAVRSDIQKQAKRIYPKAQRVIVTEVNDTDVIGGVRLSLADQQLDLTARAKLNKFKQLTETPGL